MTGQLQFALDAPPRPVAVSPERRIDITLQRLADIQESMSADELAALAGKSWWNTIVIVSRLRAMERAEEEVLGPPRGVLADIYDRLVTPGEHPCEALLRVFRATFTNGE